MSDTDAQQPQGQRPTFQDVTLYDQDTGEPFIFSAKEQEFFWRQGFTHVPKHSPERRREIREKRAKGKPIFNVTCKVCGRVGKVFSEPVLPREVYCDTCFMEAWEKYLEQHPEYKAEYEKAEAEAIALQEAGAAETAVPAGSVA